MFLNFKNNQQFFGSILIFSIIVSAIVGGTFGYYGAKFAENSIFNENFLSKLAPAEEKKIEKEIEYHYKDEQSAVVDVVKRLTPAVVSIIVSQDVKIAQAESPFDVFRDDPFFRQFFENFPVETPAPSNKTEKRQIGAGSGFIVSGDGLIVTNKHVVNFKGGSLEFMIILNNGKKYQATLLAKDPIMDLAILKISTPISGLPIVSLGDSGNLQIGQTVIAIGNALGEFSNTVSRGVISGLSRSIVASSGSSSERLSEIIQTDAAINPGNSGGPLLNLRGEVIGINTAIAQGAQNIGFAIPINQAKKAINDIKTLGRIVYPFLGIRYTTVTPEIQKDKNLKIDYGVLVVGGKNDLAVAAGSPADKAGIKEGDIITEIDSQKITSDKDLAKIIQSKKVGDIVKLKVLRNDKELVFEVKLEERQ